MKKISFYLMLTFIIASCDNKEELTSKSQAVNNPTQTYIINGDIKYMSDITDGSIYTKPKLVYDIPNEKNEIRDITSKIVNNSVNINFNYGIDGSTKSGCTVTKYKDSGETFESDYGVYGPNPYPQTNGYLVRGFNSPHHNFYYNSLIISARNKGHKTTARDGQIVNDNTPQGSAISIEFPFKANITYEISLKTFFRDNRYYIDKVHSSGFPTVYLHLKDSGIIIPDGNRESSCDVDQIIRILDANPNNIKSYTLDTNLETSKELVFKFSTTEEKKALLIALNPEIGIRGIDSKIPTNSYTMALKYVTITEKPFDPSLIVPLPPGRR